uniref:Uncharacterized protein n=1 Tax=Rhizophora mucronata TaxID=61149 RepID=A0A2P2IY96_RHIMU
MANLPCRSYKTRTGPVVRWIRVWGTLLSQNQVIHAIQQTILS